MKWTLLGTACLALAIALTGCQTPGETADTTQGPICPTCRTATKTVPTEGVAYEEHQCPKCGARRVVDPRLGSQPTHYCDTCKTAMDLCPECRKG